MFAELRVLDGPYAGQTIPVEARQVLVGREIDCQLRPTSGLVSRHHCVFRKDEYTVRVRDLGSLNGTFVNGRRVDGEVVLEDEDIVNVADVTVKISIRADANPQKSALRQTHLNDGNTMVGEQAPPAVNQTVQWDNSMVGEPPPESAVPSDPERSS